MRHDEELVSFQDASVSFLADTEPSIVDFVTGSSSVSAEDTSFQTRAALQIVEEANKLVPQAS
jgi:hypothetical protein